MRRKAPTGPATPRPGRTGRSTACRRAGPSRRSTAATAAPSTPPSGSAWTAITATRSSRPAPTPTAVAGSPDYYGWYEMYPADPVYFSNPVEPGDSMSASVTFTGTETYTLVLTDNTQDWTQTITENESGLSRSSAEVITEAPSSESGVLPLADFGTVGYGGSAVNGYSMATLDPTGIIIVDSSGNQQDTTSS